MLNLGADAENGVLSPQVFHFNRCVNQSALFADNSSRRQSLETAVCVIVEQDSQAPTAAPIKL